MKREKRPIFDSIRKPLAPGTRVFKNRKEELIEDYLDSQIEEIYEERENETEEDSEKD